MRRFVVVAWLLGMCLLGRADGVVPLPEMTAAKCVKAPVIDGIISPGEWDHAAACTGFVKAFNGSPANIQSTAWVMYDDKYLYVALKNYRASNITLLSKRGRKNDDVNIVFDQSNEIWITPPVNPATTYQTLFNAYPGVYDVKFIPSVGYSAKSWTGHWDFACTETNEYWIIEARAPISAFGMAAVKDGSLWKALFTTDNFADGDAFRAWAPGGAFADIPRHGFLRFKENSAVVQFLEMERLFSGNAHFVFGVTAPAAGAEEVTVTARLGAGLEASVGDQVLSNTVKVADGARQEFSLDGEVKQKSGYCEITAKTAAGTLLYHQVFPYTVNGFVRTPPKTLKTSPYDTPFGLSAYYAPFSKKLVVKIDRLYLAQRSAAVRGTARLTDAATGAVAAERPIAPFYCDYSEFPIDLAKLTVPVQSDDDWKAAQAVAEENKRIAADNVKAKTAGNPEEPLKPAPGPQPAKYRLAVTLQTVDGAPIATTDIPVELMGYRFEWQDNSVGISDKVIPPWTPMAWKNGTLSMWNKSYTLNGLGLAEKIVNAGTPQLSGPMKLVATVNGKELAVTPGMPEMKKLTEANAELEGHAQFGGLKLTTRTRVEFDGFVLNTLNVEPQTATRVDKLSLVVTMPTAEAPCFVTTAGGWSATHGWTPAKWDSRETSSGSITGNFVPYIFFTDSERGFCWFADNEKGWLLDPAAPTQEMADVGDKVVLRINFVTRAGIIDQPTSFTYGWMVTPQKPRPADWRATVIMYAKPYPQATPVFWRDADWAVLWPYYCSPYPWSYEKSAELLKDERQRRAPVRGEYRPCHCPLSRCQGAHLRSGGGGLGVDPRRSGRWRRHPQQRTQRFPTLALRSVGEEIGPARHLL